MIIELCKYLCTCVIGLNWKGFLIFVLKRCDIRCSQGEEVAFWLLCHTHHNALQVFSHILISGWIWLKYYSEKNKLQNPITKYHKVQLTKNKSVKKSKPCKSVNPPKSSGSKHITIWYYNVHLNSVLLTNIVFLCLA